MILFPLSRKYRPWVYINGHSMCLPAIRSISNAAAVVCSLDPETTAGIIRCGLIALWAALYLIYTSVLGHRLREWNYNTPGACFNLSSSLFSTSNPLSLINIDYIVAMYLYSLAALVVVFTRVFTISQWALKPRSVASREERSSLFTLLILCFAFIAFLIHADAIVQLRNENESLLTSGNTEQEWGFGQVSAMILLTPNVVGIAIIVSGKSKFSNPITVETEA
jgi:hypothetical protein